LVAKKNKKRKKPNSPAVGGTAGEESKNNTFVATIHQTITPFI